MFNLRENKEHTDCERTMSEREFPNIGQDPLQFKGTLIENRVYRNKAKERLKKARDIQQLGVPDQTALVWRVDLMQLFDEIAVLRGRLKAASPELFQIHERGYPE